ncbi:unnamed protein product, partial [Onchocerca flexuosa]
VQNRRRNESKERENDRKERTEERRRGRDGDERTRREERERRAKEDSDREERRQKKDKYKRRQEKESKEIGNTAEGKQGNTFKVEEEKDISAVDLKEIIVDEAKEETAPQIENRGTENDIGDAKNNMEKENDTVDEALPDGAVAESGASGFRINNDDGSGAEAENENEGLDDEKVVGNISTEVVAEEKDRNEKKKHRKRKRKHRRHEGDRPEEDENGRKKHKKHKRSKEEKEQRKQEKEKRREERRKRRQEKAGRVDVVESVENKESEYEMSSMISGVFDDDHENEVTIEGKVTVQEVKKDAM